MTARIPRNCQECGVAFLAERHRRKFCSRQCNGKSLKTNATKVCEECGTEFEVMPSALAKRRFCSMTCSGQPRPSTEPIIDDDGLSARLPLFSRDGSVRAYVTVDVNDIDFAGRWQWSLHSQGYAYRHAKVDGRTQAFFLHRELLGLTHEDNLEGDHIDRDRLNCRRTNLRALPKKGRPNAQNQSKRLNCTSLHRGVSWSIQSQKWQAYLTVNYKRYYLGTFDSEEEAAMVAKEARGRMMPFAVN